MDDFIKQMLEGSLLEQLKGKGKKDPLGLPKPPEPPDPFGMKTQLDSMAGGMMPKIK